MQDPKEIAASLAGLYWNRPASTAEINAMSGEMERDSRTIGAPLANDAKAFETDPLGFDATMTVEARS